MNPSQLPTLAVATTGSVSLPYLPPSYLHPGLSLMQLLAVLRAHLRLILLIACAVVLIAAAVTALMPRSYTAVATLMVRYEVNDPLTGREFPTGLLSSYLATQIELLQSPEVLLPVIDRLGLTSEPRYLAGYRAAYGTPREWVLMQLQEKLSIAQGRMGSQLIHVTFIAHEPDLAARVANAIADLYVQQQSDRLGGPATEYAERYASQLAELSAKVERAQQQVTSFRARHSLVEAAGTIDIDMEMLSTLEQRLLEAQQQRRIAEARFADDTGARAEILGSTLVQGFKTQIAGLLARRAELQRQLGDSHPEMQALDAQLAQTRRSLSAEISNYTDNARSELAAARSLETKLEAAVQQHRDRLMAVRRYQDEGSQYLIELDSARAVYKSALDGYDQVALAAKGSYRNVTVESRAMRPLRPSRPNVLKYMAFGVVAGAVLGVLLPLLWELLHRRIRSRDDFERDHGIPVLMDFDAIPTRT